MPPGLTDRENSVETSRDTDKIRLRRRLAGQIRRIRGEESGFTLVELLVSTSVLVVVFGGILFLIPPAFEQSTRGPERSFTVTETRLAVDTFVRELRTATVISTPTSQILRFDTPTRSVTIECTEGQGQGGAGQGQGAGICNRREAPLGQNPANNPARAIASRVENTDIFGIAQGGQPSNRDYVCIKVVISVDGADAPVTIQDGVALRNNQAPALPTPACSTA